MEKIEDMNEFLTQAGLYKQRMTGYKEKNYILQVFSACEPSWFYVLIYKDNDELIGVFTFITDGKETMTKIKFARNTRVVERLMKKLIRIKEAEYVFED